MHLKDARKEATYFAFATSEGMWRSISAQLGADLRHVRMMLPEEIVERLLRGGAPLDHEALLRRREQFLLRWEAGHEKHYSGRHAEDQLARIIGQEEEADLSAQEILGTCAVPGTATGRVRIANTPQEASLLLNGEILVSIATDPTLEAAMARAAAIVTDMGGVTCHAAVVSRELGIPCVVGTRIASHVLRTGERVAVDAGRGRIVRTP
jgi:phosphoenolpyruvate synthase/pyruvate phosphate dikinase